MVVSRPIFSIDPSMSKDDFDIFRHSKVPSMTSGTSNTVAKIHAGGDVNSNIVMSFQKSIKLDVGQYPDFKGNLEGWLPFKRRLKAVAATQLSMTGKNIMNSVRTRTRHGFLKTLLVIKRMVG